MKMELRQMMLQEVKEKRLPESPPAPAAPPTRPRVPHLWARNRDGKMCQISDDMHSPEQFAFFERIYAESGFTEFHYR